MIEEVINYAVVCDKCGKVFRDRFWGKNAFEEKIIAVERAVDEGWLRMGDKFYCPDCDTFEDEDEDEEEEDIKNLSSIGKKVILIVRKHTSVKSVTPASKPFKDLVLSEREQLRIVIELESVFSISISDRDVDKFCYGTVGTLIKIVERKLNMKNNRK